MFAERQLCEFRDKIGRLIEEWGRHEGLEGETFDRLADAESAAHAELVKRAKLEWDPGPCGGCVPYEEPNMNAEWNLAKIFIDPFLNQFQATFFCKTCGNKVWLDLTDDTRRSNGFKRR